MIKPRHYLVCLALSLPCSALLAQTAVAKKPMPVANGNNPNLVNAKDPAWVLASETQVQQLKPGQWLWNAEAVPEGPMLLMVSISQQKAYLYRNGIRVAVSTVSTGKKGHETPTGVFTILQKNKDHKSNLYTDTRNQPAPMPFMQRLTWDGIALHAGNLPGYPASHGCVRMPMDFARRLFSETELGMTVIVSNILDKPTESSVLDPSVFAQTIDSTGRAQVVEPLDRYEDYRWQPEKSPFGPVTVVVSTRQNLAVVLRNGVEIGRSKVGVIPNAVIKDQAYLVLEGESKQRSRIVPGRNELNWLQVSTEAGATPVLGLDGGTLKNVIVPIDFAKQVYSVLRPGSAMLVTHGDINLDTPTQGMTVLTDETDAEHDAETE